MSSIQELKQVSKSIRKNILNMAFTAEDLVLLTLEVLFLLPIL